MNKVYILITSAPLMCVNAIAFRRCADNLTYTHHTRKSEYGVYIFFYDPSTYPKSAYHFSG